MCEILVCTRYINVVHNCTPHVVYASNAVYARRRHNTAYIEGCEPRIDARQYQKQSYGLYRGPGYIAEFVPCVRPVDRYSLVQGGIDASQRSLIHYYSVTGRRPDYGYEDTPGKIIRVFKPIYLRTENSIQEPVTEIEYRAPHNADRNARANVRYEKQHLK